MFRKVILFVALVFIAVASAKPCGGCGGGCGCGVASLAVSPVLSACGLPACGLSACGVPACGLGYSLPVVASAVAPCGLGYGLGCGGYGRGSLYYGNGLCL